MSSKLLEVQTNFQTTSKNIRKQNKVISKNQHEKPSKHNLMNELFDKNNGPAKQPIVLCNSGQIVWHRLIRSLRVS